METSKTSSALMGRFVTHCINRRRTQNSSNQHKRDGKLYEESNENKENISQNPLRPRPNETRSKLKSAVSYTVFFDKKPSYFISTNYAVSCDLFEKHEFKARSGISDSFLLNDKKVDPRFFYCR